MILTPRDGTVFIRTDGSKRIVAAYHPERRVIEIKRDGEVCEIDLAVLENITQKQFDKSKNHLEI